MKKMFNIWGLVVGIMFLVPYIFLGKQWDVFATFLSVMSIAFIISIIARYFRSRS